MRLVWTPRPTFLLLFLAVVLVLSSLIQSISKQRNLQISLNPLFVFSLCNIIIFAIIVGDPRPPTEEVDSILPFLTNSAEHTTDIDDEGSNKHCHIDGHVNGSEDVDDQVDESEEEDEDHDSDGYYEDDDDNGSNDDIGWEDTDESDDDDLETRVQNFIDRVYDGWREERLRDSLCNPLQFFGF